MKNIRMLALTVLTVLWVACASHAFAASAVEKLTEQLAPLTAITGRFTQIQKDAEGDVFSRSSGTFTMQRPGMLRWETVEPFPQLLVTDGNKIWLYDEDLEQVTISSVDEQLNQTPAIIFSGELNQIKQQFDVYTKDGARFSLKPKGSGEVYQRLDIEFENNLIKRMMILDGFGQTTEFFLTDVTATAVKPLSYFQFQAPQGTDVLVHE